MRHGKPLLAAVAASVLATAAMTAPAQAQLFQSGSAKAAEK